MTSPVLLYGLLLLHTVATCCLVLYGMNCYTMIFLHRRACRSMLRHDAAVQQTWHARTPSYPRVTVQLPVYNERYVIQRLIEAVVSLQYPRACLEIQLLDDSTD
ncbi:MAG: hypothetical protein HYZ81_10425, partial [Nitrospinae bacterium]|nr:hypothetical protein [Nitrospinota bacterium]